MLSTSTSTVLSDDVVIDADVHAVLDALAGVEMATAVPPTESVRNQVFLEDATPPAILAAGMDEPESSLTFAQLGVPADLCAELDQLGITTPFPVQAATLPDCLAGLDVCGQAPTGSGKTLAYGLAVMARVSEGQSGRPKALILVPVRELAEQVTRALVPFGRGRRRWVQALVGGQDIYRQIDALRRGVAVAVATPGRMSDLVRRGDADLSGVEIVVIDEADRMGDMGFMPQVRELLDDIQGTPQVLLFSATLDGDVGELIKEYQKDPVHHSAEGIAGSLDEDGLAGEHLRVQVRHDNKLNVAATLAGPTRKTLVFVKNRFATERTADQISDLGVAATHLHGGLTQSGRARALRAWTNGEVKVLVATDLVARGLHVEGVDLVLHLDPPQDIKDYVHRSGRTGRAGAQGTVVNLIRKEQRRGTMAMENRLGVTARDVDITEVLQRLRVQVAEAQVSEAAESQRQTELRKGRPERPERPDRGSRSPRGRDDRGGYGGSGGSGGRPRSSAPDRDRGARGFERIADRPTASERPAYGDRATTASRPQGDRPWQDRPSPAAPRPASDRAWQDRSAPAAPRPASDRAWQDRSAPAAARPASDRAWQDRSAPAAARPASDRAWQDRSAPAAPRPASDRAWQDRSAPAAARPAGGRTWQDRSQTARPTGDRPAGDRPRDGVARSFSPTDDRPAWANPKPKPTKSSAKPWNSR